MSSSSTTEARELDLVGKVEMRIALAEDTKLESMLKTYLPPLLLKLASDHVNVRNKVISTCQHIKVRLAGNQNITLPVAALLKQYKDHPQSSMIRHFDLMFIQQSIGKLSASEQLDLLPVLIHGLAQDAGKPTCSTVFNLFLRLLPRLKIPLRGSTEDSELRSKLGFDTHSDDAKFVSTWIGKLILFTILRPSVAEAFRTAGQADTGVAQAFGNGGVFNTSNRANTPPQTLYGLTVDDYNFLSLDGKADTWDPNSPEGLNLAATKITCLSFLASGAFTDDERFLPALFASADSNSRISDIGEDLLKRTGVSLEDSERVTQLYQLYFVLRPALKTRILLLFAKSVFATKFPREIIKMAQEGLNPEDPTMASVKGLEAQKLRNAMFSFVNWIARMGSKEDLQQLAPPLVHSLRSFIEAQGWPVPADKGNDAVPLRALAYETLGTMAQRTPSIVREEDLTLVKWLFRSMTEDGSSSDIFVSIEGALASLISALAPPLDAPISHNLRVMLLEYMSVEEDDNIRRSPRFATVRWANRCLPYSDIVGRWIDILALGGRLDERSDVVEEGKKGLDPYWYQLLNPDSVSSKDLLPDLNQLINTFFTASSLVENSHAANTMRTGMELDGVSVFGNFSGTKITAFSTAITYCKRMICMKALQCTENALTIDADWERQLDVLFRTDLAARDNIRNFLKAAISDSLITYVTAAFEGTIYSHGNGLGDCGASLVEMLSLAPSSVAGELASRSKELLPAIYSNNAGTRVIAARAFGILTPHPNNSDTDIQGVIDSLLETGSSWATAVGAEANKVHGSILAIGYLLSRAVYYERSTVLRSDTILKVLEHICDISDSATDASMKEAVFIAIGQLCASGILGVKNMASANRKITSVLEKLTAEAKKGDERAITAIGRLAMTYEDAALDSQDSVSSADSPTVNINIVLKSLFDLHELRQAETHFTIGEALSSAAGGWDSDAMKLGLDVDSAYKGYSAKSQVLAAMLEKLLTDCKTTKPSLKKASGIWLFCLVKDCGHLPEVQNRLRECQAAFMGLLSAREDIVQETASRGLSLVYEQGDKDLKERLVSDLVASFTGTTTKIKVDEETELFEPGALPTGEGQSITSYKDIMSLAAEVGDQSLVYKFMSLASNAATWSTRAAFGRFGLSSILSESEVDPKLYPKLYRYRFDPNTNVQRSMNDIWSALVKDSSGTIDEYFDPIMDDLLKNILGREWRARQASCAAIADLVQGRQFEKYEKYLGHIWEVTFKVLDDIKGSVRKAAMSLFKVLTGVLVRQLEAGATVTSKNADTMLKNVLPFLLSPQGLESSSEEVRLFALSAVLDIVKKGGKTLRPFIPTLVERLIGLFSTLEHDNVQMIHLNARNYGLTEEKIDQLRSNAVASSPLMEAIDRCLDLLDEPTMAELAPVLENVIKTAIGIPSKVGCSAVLVTLSTRHSFIFKPQADIFLKAIEKAALDRNSTVSSAYARASGYVARLGSDKQILKFSTYSMNLYFGAEDEAHRQVAADIVYAISKFATDRFNSLASEFLPFVFLAKHDADDHVKDQFEKTWSENVGGSRAVLLYLKEILALAVTRLESPKWTIKHTAAITIADVVTSAGNDISHSNAEVMWPALEKALALKTFEGKEKVLVAFAKITKDCRALWEKGSVIAAQAKKIAIREAKRNNDVYRPHAFLALGEYAEARTDIDMFDDVYNIIHSHFEEVLDEDKMDTTDDSKNNQVSRESLTITAGISALLRSVNVTKARSVFAPHLLQIIDTVKIVLKSPKSTVGTRTALYERSKALFENMKKHTHTQTDATYDIPLSFAEILEITGGAGSELVRTKRAEAAEAVVVCLFSGVFGTLKEGRDDCKERVAQLIREALKDERANAVRGIYERALKVLDSA